MATLLEYFTNDFKSGSIDKDIFLQEITGAKPQLVVKEKIIFDLNCSARFHAYFIPKSYNVLDPIITIINNLEASRQAAAGLEIISKFYSDVTLGTNTPNYLNNLYFYTETSPTAEEITILIDIANTNGLYMTIRSEDYIKAKIEIEKPLAFISHDSRNKDLIARPLANGLQSRLCTVWYDEYSMKIGDSLRQSIEEGIKEAKKCILILTPEFLNNPGWGKKEFDSIFTREMILEERVILPIWHNVTKREVYEYSPSLADTVALIWPEVLMPKEEYDRKIEELLSKLHTSIISL